MFSVVPVKPDGLMAREAVVEGVAASAKALPGLAKDFAHAAVPIAFPSEHEKMAAEIKGMLSRKLGK